MASFSAGTTFTDGVANDVTAAKLAALVNAATPTSGLIQDRTAESTIAADDTLLFGDFSDSNNLKRMTVANFRSAATFGTTTSTAATITSGTITTLNSTTGTITTGVIPTLTSSTATFGTTTSTAATITSGTVTNLDSTTGTIATLNSTTGTIATLDSTTGTIATLNSTTGTIATLNSTTGTIQSLTSSTASVSDIVTTKNIAINVTTLATASGTQNIDFTSEGYLTHSITGDITYTASNYAEGKSLTIRITSDGTARNLAFPSSWVFVGSKPTSIAASKVAILSVTSFGATEANTVAAYAVQT
jgi:hypothetical protein